MELAVNKMDMLHARTPHLCHTEIALVELTVDESDLREVTLGEVTR